MFFILSFKAIPVSLALLMLLRHRWFMPFTALNKWVKIIFSFLKESNLSCNQGSVSRWETRTSGHHSTTVTPRQTQHKQGWVQLLGEVSQDWAENRKWVLFQNRHLLFSTLCSPELVGLWSVCGVQNYTEANSLSTLTSQVNTWFTDFFLASLYLITQQRKCAGERGSLQCQQKSPL